MTSELAPTLGPEEFAALLGTMRFMSHEGTVPDRAEPDKELTGAGLWPSLRKKIPELEDDRVGPPPPATRDGATEGVGPSWQLESR